MRGGKEKDNCPWSKMYRFIVEIIEKILRENNPPLEASPKMRGTGQGFVRICDFLVYLIVFI